MRKFPLAKIVGVAALPAAVIVSGLLVFGGSTAAFSGTTSNEGNTWSAGSIQLTNNQASALFTASNIAPGYSETHCITINSTSTIPTNLKMYAANVTGTGTTDTLDANLNVTVTPGVGGTDSDCTGFTASGPAAFSGDLKSFGATSKDYSTGVGSVALPASASAQYQITVGLPSSAPNSLQGTTAGASFVWEAQN